MTTPLLMLRSLELGLSLQDLDLLSIGMITDMYIEKANDAEYAQEQEATQEDFDRF